jgi:Zn-dependent protease with chaperone function
VKRMAIGCFAGFIIDLDKALLTTIALSLAVVFLYAIKKFDLSTKAKIGLIYGHLILISFPLVLFTTNFACGAMCMPCYGDSAVAMLSYSLPSAILIATFAGLFVIPAFYTFSGKKHLRNKEINSFLIRHSRKLKIKTPRIYAIDKAKPVAFSFKSLRSAIFISVGMMDILSKKELQSVLLHELSHIKQKSSVLKISSSILNIFSPLSLLARFHYDTGKEEIEADKFAIKIQGTSRYINSSKRKIRNYK